MTEEMIEKLAEIACLGGFEDLREELAARNPSYWSTLPEDTREAYRRRVRAVLAAIEPVTAHKLVPLQATDEIIRTSLATEQPATFRTHLRHPSNGPKTASETEKLIEREHRRWAAMMASVPSLLKDNA